MDRIEMVKRLEKIHYKLNFSCYGLYDALNRYGKKFDWMEKCRAYERAAKVLEERLGF